MFHNHLKQGFRLSRTIGFCLIAYTTLALVSLKMPGSTLHLNSPWIGLRLSLAGVSAIVFLLLNEVSLRSFKRHPRLDDITLEKLSLLLPVATALLVSFHYLLLGQFGLILLGVVVSLQAQLFGHNTVARTLLIIFGSLYLASFGLGYPVLLGLQPNAFQGLSLGIKFLLMSGPAILALNHLGGIVASTQRHTSSRVSKLQSLAATDGLTGLVNRRQFNQQLDAEMARARRYRKPLSLALFDIDDFKKINDFYGHTTGDRILKELGQMISQNIRESDVAARYGGEEFALILPETGQIDAYELLERLRAMIERTVFCLPDNPITATISVGVAQLDLNDSKGYEIIEKSDAALYEAKKQGKNRVVYGTLTPPKVNYPSFES